MPDAPKEVDVDALATASGAWADAEKFQMQLNRVWLALEAFPEKRGAIRVLERQHKIIVDELHRLQWELAHPGERYGI